MPQIKYRDLEGREREKSKKPYYILIDESGTLPDPKDKFVVIAGVGLKELKEMKKDLSYTIQHIDSQQNFIINLADFVAGAVLTKYNKNNFQFSMTKFSK